MAAVMNHQCNLSPHRKRRHPGQEKQKYKKGKGGSLEGQGQELLLTNITGLKILSKDVSTRFSVIRACESSWGAPQHKKLCII